MSFLSPPTRLWTRLYAFLALLNLNFPAPGLEPVQDSRRRQEDCRQAEGPGGRRAARPVLGRRRGRVGVGVAAGGGAVVLARAAVLAQTQVLK